MEMLMENYCLFIAGTPSTPIMPGGTPGTPSSKTKVNKSSFANILFYLNLSYIREKYLSVIFFLFVYKNLNEKSFPSKIH